MWLRLHLLSHRLVRAARRSASTASSGCSTNVVWTSAGPCAVEGFEQTRLRLRAAGQHVTVLGVDKFPRMVDYVRARRRPHRRRRPGPPRRPPGRGHDGHARGLRQLQRRHPRRLDGRGPDLRRASSSATAPTSAAAPRSWAPSPAAASEVDLDRRALPDRRQRRHRHLARRRLRRRGRLLRHGRHQGHRDGHRRKPQVVKAVDALGQPTTCCSAATPCRGAVEAVPWKGERHRAQRGPARELSDCRRVASSCVVLGAWSAAPASAMLARRRAAPRPARAARPRSRAHRRPRPGAGARTPP